MMTRGSEGTSLFSSLSTHDKILLGLLTAGAVVEDIIGECPADPFHIRALSRGLSFENIDFYEGKKKNLRNALSKFLAKKLIEVRKVEKERLYSLTEEGLEALFHKFPKLKYGQRPWDGFWRLVVYDIGESQAVLRNRLREELKRLGFKYVQKSVWICPYSIEEELEELLKKEQLWGRILIFKAVVSRKESRKLVREFRGRRDFKGVLAGGPAAIERLLADPLLPKGL